MKDISFLAGYHVWAHTKVLDKLKEITAEEWNQNVGGSFPTMQELCKHLITADYRWLMRWKGVPFAPIPDTFLFDGYTQVYATWRPILEDIEATTKQFVESDADKIISFITSTGKSFNMPFWQTLYQVVNHGTYHRGQLTNMLRILGKEAVGTDIFLFFVEKGIK